MVIKKMNNTISDRFQLIRKFLGFNTQAEFAKALGVTQGRISSAENGEIASKEVLITLSNKYNISIDWYLTGEGSMLKNVDDNIEFVQPVEPEYKKELPVYEYPVSAGYSGTFEENHVQEHMSWFSRADFIMKINGTSMLPIIPDGAYVGIKRTNKNQDGKPMLVRYKDEHDDYYHAIKYVKISGNECELISANKAFTNIIPCGFLDIIGVVVDIFKRI